MTKKRQSPKATEISAASTITRTSAHQPKRNDQLGRWILQNRLGRGGNGEVWLAVDSSGAEVAIKLLMKMRPVPYERFKSEVAALTLVAGVKGILPLVDSHLPSDLAGDRPWYAMPVAVPLLETVKRATTQEKVRAVAEVAETMSHLHKKGVAHRDIKPGNLLVFEGRCHISDFGLVDYPEKADITEVNEQLGPRWTMAPEVRREGNASDPKPADVNSLTKTLWILLTGDATCFEGQYVSERSQSIKDHCGRRLHHFARRAACGRHRTPSRTQAHNGRFP